MDVTKLLSQSIWDGRMDLAERAVCRSELVACWLLVRIEDKGDMAEDLVTWFGGDGKGSGCEIQSEIFQDLYLHQITDPRRGQGLIKSDFPKYRSRIVVNLHY
jgi:hypothetical protein